MAKDVVPGRDRAEAGVVETVMFGFLWPKKKKRSPDEPRDKRKKDAEYSVTFDDHLIILRKPDGTKQAVRWTSLAAVMVEAKNYGTPGAEVKWLLLGRSGRSGCIIPHGIKGEKELFAQLKKLPGFDYHPDIAAMALGRNQQYLCWKAV